MQFLFHEPTTVRVFFFTGGLHVRVNHVHGKPVFDREDKCNIFERTTYAYIFYLH